MFETYIDNDKNSIAYLRVVHQQIYQFITDLVSMLLKI